MFLLLSDSQLKLLVHFDRISLAHPNDCYMNSFEAYEGLPSEDRLLEKKPHCTDYWSKDLEVKLWLKLTEKCE